MPLLDIEVVVPETTDLCLRVFDPSKDVAVTTPTKDAPLVPSISPATVRALVGFVVPTPTEDKVCIPEVEGLQRVCGTRTEFLKRLPLKLIFPFTSKFVAGSSVLIPTKTLVEIPG
jgi:hypothetical protein